MVYRKRKLFHRVTRNKREKNPKRQNDPENEQSPTDFFSPSERERRKMTGFLYQKTLLGRAIVFPHSVPCRSTGIRCDAISAEESARTPDSVW